MEESSGSFSQSSTLWQSGEFPLDVSGPGEFRLSGETRLGVLVSSLLNLAVVCIRQIFFELGILGSLLQF